MSPPSSTSWYVIQLARQGLLQHVQRSAIYSIPQTSTVWDRPKREASSIPAVWAVESELITKCNPEGTGGQGEEWTETAGTSLGGLEKTGYRLQKADSGPPALIIHSNRFHHFKLLDKQLKLMDNTEKHADLSSAKRDFLCHSSYWRSSPI